MRVLAVQFSYFHIRLCDFAVMVVCDTNVEYTDVHPSID